VPGRLPITPKGSKLMRGPPVGPCWQAGQLGFHHRGRSLLEELPASRGAAKDLVECLLARVPLAPIPLLARSCIEAEPLPTAADPLNRCAALCLRSVRAVPPPPGPDQFGRARQYAPRTRLLLHSVFNRTGAQPHASAPPREPDPSAALTRRASRQPTPWRLEGTSELADKDRRNFARRRSHP